jgi:glucose-1-phosphate thymidylyltransferase
VIDLVLDKIERLREIKECLILVNPKFQRQFKEWLKKRASSNVKLVPDKREKVGAIKAFADAVHGNDDSDLLVLCSDSIFDDDLTGFLKFFYENKRFPVMALYHAKTLEETKRGSNVIIDADKRILEFEEKPVFPKTILVGACIYAFPREINQRLKEYLNTGLGIDEPGRFIEWLHKRQIVYGYELKGDLIDIGTVESYMRFGAVGRTKKRRKPLVP